jgi:predicted 3-demethylubiquinone-9 3-methyltransferase (glyoxalase superfamily)
VAHLDGESDMVKPAKNTICFWYDGDAEDAAQFYAKTFPDSSAGAVNGGPAFKHSEAFSFQVATADQAETDRYWNAIVGSREELGLPVDFG